MITEFKLFENIDDGEPKKGDWIIVYKERITIHQSYLGQITSINEGEFKYLIQAVNITQPRWVSRSEISHFGTKEEMEMIIHANKYNV